jgi:hypothetical protein
MKKILLALMLGISFSQSFAGTSLLKNGQPTQQENAQTGEQISAMTVLISNYKQFKHEWDNTDYSHAPRAQQAEKAKVGDTVHLVTFFSNCLPDSEQMCSMSFQVNVYQNDTLITSSQKVSQQLKKPSGLQMSNLTVGTKFDENETGDFRYEVTVTDENADDTVLLKTKIKVSPK